MKPNLLPEFTVFTTEDTAYLLGGIAVFIKFWGLDLATLLCTNQTRLFFDRSETWFNVSGISGKLSKPW